MAEKKEVDWEAKYKKLVAKNKNTKPKEDKFVSENLEAFAEILDPNKPFMQKFGKRYSFSRKDRTNTKMEFVIKINKLVSDLIDAKILLNDGVDNVANRRSMDVGSLIKSLGGQRINEDDFFAFKSWQRELKQKMRGQDPQQQLIADLRKQIGELEQKIADQKIAGQSAPAKPAKLKQTTIGVVEKMIAGNAKPKKQKPEQGWSYTASFEGVKRTPDGKKFICPFPSNDKRSDQWLDDHPAIDADYVVFTDS